MLRWIVIVLSVLAPASFVVEPLLLSPVMLLLPFMDALIFTCLSSRLQWFRQIGRITIFFPKALYLRILSTNFFDKGIYLITLCRLFLLNILILFRIKENSPAISIEFRNVVLCSGWLRQTSTSPDTVSRKKT